MGEPNRSNAPQSAGSGARFQWNRALSFDPDAEVALRIRKKLDVGLDVVLNEEGEDPIAVAQDG